MNNQDSDLEKLEIEIKRLIDKELEEKSALLGINIGTHGGRLIASTVKKESKLSNSEIVAANSSFLFLSSRMLSGSLNQEISYNLIAGKKIYLLSMLTDSINIISYLNREIAELEGVQKYINDLKKFALKITAIVDTSQVIKEELFVEIKRAIPNTLVLAIITKEGLPIKIQSTMAEPLLSGMISAVYHVSEVLLENPSEYSIISGENGSIIIHGIDNTRILCIAVPEANERKLGSYIAKIKAIIKLH